ncbi:MAG: universal stress protein [Bacteroidia bacterium]
MKRILTPVDFSEDSINALQHAIYIAKKMGAEIHLLHVKPDKSVFSLFGNSKDEFSETEIADNLDRLIDRLSTENGISLHRHIRAGKISREIAQAAEEIDTFMIVMGTHGRSGVEEFWMGSNSFKVVSQAPCPVLTLRKNFEQYEITRIVLPLDNSPETRQKVPHTVEFAKYFNASIHVLAVISDRTEGVINRITRYQMQVVDYIKEYDVDWKTDTVYGDNITNATIEYAKEVKASLIAIMTEQEIDASNLVLGPYAQQMVNHSPIPVYSVRPRQDIHVSLY